MKASYRDGQKLRVGVTRISRKAIYCVDTLKQSCSPIFQPTWIPLCQCAEFLDTTVCCLILCIAELRFEVYRTVPQKSSLGILSTMKDWACEMISECMSSIICLRIDLSCDREIHSCARAFPQTACGVSHRFAFVCNLLFLLCASPPRFLHNGHICTSSLHSLYR
ncbi:unnamed protein product [Albugo candida]|uniref:Uncharacterized protein n=1 Tax=Albugo candida TaxID=65357 RepID=A0A024FV59_9STRA|nr:unnamed protein product [Albugo candida]|eukprot:CCI10822.1 unnamed protein product [Albugo candida]